MDASLLLQYVVITLAVLGSAGYVIQRQWPGPVRRLRTAWSLPLLRDGRPGWLQALGRRIAPSARIDAGACGTGCGGCGPTSPQ